MINAYVPKGVGGKKLKEKHTVQMPAFLNSLRNSGSLSSAASFSYFNSSAIFADRALSATSAVKKTERGKRKT
jgi:hypothetical protein